MIRIVKMCFRPECVEDFKQLFEERKALIRAQEGCTHLELLRDINNPSVFFTYSFWQDPEYLEQYRQSAFFADTWARTKALFAEKAAAWSVAQEVVIP
ncbi:MAG: antibiotic biosynthesis monooxygenase [Taibaiella sp.]|nr:antibiotic biosynthesis monooxygenase [Taibaiella sp.]